MHIESTKVGMELECINEIEDNTNVVVLFVGASHNFVIVGIFLPRGGSTHPTTCVAIRPLNCGSILVFFTHSY